ncbi:MAG: Zn-dependent protease, modulator of gyrase [Gammaproteobacteria bacterium]|jgi:PmbA protein|nr:Zn-dependent protease, modulator of gyrase [Gammaproteobacteria bacterium]
MNKQNLPSQQQLSEVVEHALKQARQKGASSAEIAVSSGLGFSATIRKAEVETIEHEKDQAIDITVYFGKKKGSATTTDMSFDLIDKVVERACVMAQYTIEDDCAGLPEQADMATDWPELDLYHPWDITVEEAIKQAKACEKIAFDCDPRINNSEGATLETYQAIHLYANSYGFIGEELASRHGLSLSVIAEQNGQMQHDYSYSSARDYKDLWPIEKIAHEAVDRTLKKLNPRKLKTCEVPVIFSADIASSLISSFLNAISGGSLYRRSSFLVDSLGQKLFPDFVRITEDPYILKGLGSCPFDGEGVRVKPRDIVQQGTLQGYLLSSYSARKLKMKTTGNAGGVHNILVSSGSQDLQGLIKTMQKGLIVTDVIGQGVNLVTGDYSRGASGFWVENGEIQFPVEEITIAGNLRDMFKGIIEIGTDIEKRSKIQVGSILINKMMVAGN